MGIEGAGHDGGPTRRSILSGALAAGLAGCATTGGGDGGVPGTPRLLGHRRHGRGPEPVVVLHEWLGDHSNYDPVLPYLPENSATWILADLRGYGWSKPVAGAHSLAEAAADVTRLMDHYGYARFHVVGAHDIPLYREDSIRKLLGPLFPNLQVEVSREAGHYAMLETPALLAGVLERGIARGA